MERFFCRKKTPGGRAGGLAPGVWSYPITLCSLVVRSTAQTQGGGWVGGVHFQKVQFFNYFRHNKSEPDLTVDCMFTMFFNFCPNRFRLNMEPHELVWKSVTAILHRILVSIFKVFFNLRYMKPDSYFHMPEPNKCVFGPGDAWVCSDFTDLY